MSTVDTRKRIVMVAGTRPEAIKLAPVYLELRDSPTLKPVWLSTGQHRELLAQAMDAFGLEADHDLRLMQEAQKPMDVLTRGIEGIAAILARESPAAVLVQGDTTTVLAAALAAFYAGVPVGHVEAGLRTYDMRSPWPEEMARRVTAPLSRWNFAPTQQALDNLLAERIEASLCYLTGNTGIDAVLGVRSRIGLSKETPAERAARLGISTEFFRDHLDQAPRFILLTLHRRESFAQGLADVCRGVLQALADHPDVAVVCPMHPNPAARGPLLELLSGRTNAALVEPVGYADFVWLLSRCSVVVTDSGGVQEEAPSLGKRVIVARETTERVEGVLTGGSVLVGTNPGQLAEAVKHALADRAPDSSPLAGANPYGDGLASKRIRNILEETLR